MRFLTPVTVVPKHPKLEPGVWKLPNLALTNDQVEIAVSRVKGQYLRIVCDSYNEANYLAQRLKARNRAHTSTAHLDIVVRGYIVYAMEFDWTKVKVGPPIRRRNQFFYQTLCKECNYPLDQGGRHHPSCSQYENNFSPSSPL